MLNYEFMFLLFLLTLGSMCVGTVGFAVAVMVYQGVWAKPRARARFRKAGQTIDGREAIERWRRGEGTMVSLACSWLHEDVWWTPREVEASTHKLGPRWGPGWTIEGDPHYQELVRMNAELGSIGPHGARLLVNIEGLEAEVQSVRHSETRFVDFGELFWGKHGEMPRGDNCRWCGYSIVGLDEASKCPECGGGLRMRGEQTSGERA